jgi:hypothetical protein
MHSSHAHEQRGSVALPDQASMRPQLKKAQHMQRIWLRL